MLRRALIALAIIALLAGGAAWLAFNYPDVGLKWALEHYGPDVAGVSVKVREVQISPTTGKGAVRALELGNPPGFNAPHSVRLGEIRLQVDPGTITEPVIVVHELSVEDPVITYERGEKGANLEVIQRSIEAYAKGVSDGSTPAAKAGKPREARRRFIVEKLTLKGAKVTMTNPALKGQGITFEIPDVTLRDVGKRQGGLTGSELANVVANALMQRIAQKVLTNVDLLRKGGVEGAIDALKGLLR